ncbi:MAG TPA: saccharopine dehydrogenase NADP-binding domain-containing protein [Ilumatobacter sp.]|nr:saccharopine dehydrogenase NADP-binding domain-containing protein [Ilumatobacter sp.]
MAAASDRPYDLVVFGATSFVGQILTTWLVERAPTDLRWAIAGRNRSKLADVADTSGAEVELIVADAGDHDAMDALAASSRVVVSTVGPYALYGSPLVAAVARAGTDYCDLTGEPQWMRAMIDAHQAAAERTGARIVHACGFDSIPSDLGVWFTQQSSIRRFGVPCTSIAFRLKAARGGASGGTIASGLNLVEEARRDPGLRAMLGNPYALAPEGMRSGPRQPNVTMPQRDPASGAWVAPFIMAATNTRVVQRTHALLGRPWGDEFEYDEAMSVGAGPIGALKAVAVAGGMAGFAGAAAFGPTRSLLRKVLPDPGEGPSPETQEAGFFDVRLYGRTADGDEIATKVTGDRDPGYGSTARMLAEAALAFRDVDHTDVGGGFWTPATAFGDLLVERLVAHAGLTFDVL